MNELINKIPVLILHNYVQKDADGKTLHWQRVVNSQNELELQFFDEQGNNL